MQSQCKQVGSQLLKKWANLVIQITNQYHYYKYKKLIDKFGMHITYGIIYYFVLLVLLLTALLALFLIRPLRMKLLRLTSEGGFNLDNQIIFTALYFTFAVLIAVLLDSGWTFKQLYQFSDFESFANNSGITIADYKQIGVIHKEMYLSLYRKYREYFIAQRNFILSCSACFVWFIFCRLLVIITEISSNQKQIAQAKARKTIQQQKTKQDKINNEDRLQASLNKSNKRGPLMQKSNNVELKQQLQEHYSKQIDSKDQDTQNCKNIFLKQQ